MKNLILAISLFLGVAVAAPAFAAGQSYASPATPSASGEGAFLPGYGYYVCPYGMSARYFFSAGFYYATTYNYAYYPPVLMTQPWWISGPGVYCVP